MDMGWVRTHPYNGHGLGQDSITPIMDMGWVRTHPYNGHGLGQDSPL